MDAKASEFVVEDRDGNQFKIEVYLGPMIARLCANAKHNGGEASLHMGGIRATQLKEQKRGNKKRK